ncbi:MAG: metal-dependent hydrolase [Cytophagales bacterium]|nr:metal-dependent hydrolase [Cytophagales bacterium]
MKLTYFGHSCFQIESEGVKVLFDPFIEGNPLASDIKVDDIETDFILVSHGHGDHVSDVEKVYAQTGAQLISTFEVVNWFQQKGIENSHPMNHGGKISLDFGTAKMVNAVHSSSMPDGSYGGHPAGFVISATEKTFYFAGDTALHQDMKQIADEFALDFAVLPIGDNFTMGIDDALKAADYVGTNHIIGVHYDTFPVIKINQDEAIAKAETQNKKLQLLKIGETIVI